jgi:calcineurin-like phosphoesterase family protein
MARMRQFHNPELSIWQSAVEEVAAKRATATRTEAVGAAAVVSGRPDTPDPMTAEATAYCHAVDSGQSVAEATAGHVATEGLVQTAGFCSLTALKLAKAKILGNQADEQRYKDELAKFGDCDPGYAEAAAKYAEYFVAQQGKIPYVMYQSLGDFVISDKLEDTAKVAVLGDWGTGQDAAKLVLRQIASRKPDIVIHLGDIYYSGTDHEISNYFYQPWQQILGLASNPIPTFTLAGNHDMYCGGVPYYSLLKTLGQPASYFCLRNAKWQIIALDTGYNDHNPTGGGTGATFLQDTEVTWLEDKVNNAGGRQTILLSHHQLFTAFDAIAGSAVNMRLYSQISSLLPELALWLWGHEHNFVVYDSYQGLKRSCCLGHGAFPVGIDELPSELKFAEVPLRKNADGSDIRLGTTGAIYNHGYAMIELKGEFGTISYYQDSDEDSPMYQQSLT